MPSWHSDVCDFKYLSANEDIWLEKKKHIEILFYYILQQKKISLVK